MRSIPFFLVVCLSLSCQNDCQALCDDLYAFVQECRREICVPQGLTGEDCPFSFDSDDLSRCKEDYGIFRTSQKELDRCNEALEQGESFFGTCEEPSVDTTGSFQEG